MLRPLAVSVLALGLITLGAAAVSPEPASSESSSASRRGGTLRVDLTSDFDYIDTSLAYFSHSWQMQNATQLKLLSFPEREGAAGRRIVPEAAAGMPKVSKDRKTYRFTIRRGFRFSDGSNVTAANFAAAFRRARNRRMQSPAAGFLRDVRDWRTQGDYSLAVRLNKPAPDFLARMTMPFFSAIPTNRPIVAGGVGAPLVSAGPYYVRSWVKGRSAVAVRNPHWRFDQAPWRHADKSANPDQIVWNMGNSLDATLARLRRNETDLGDVPPSRYGELAQEFGINKGRFFVRKNVVLWYLALNNDSPLFRGNPKLRQAVNWAIDRPQLVRQHGYLGGTRTDQILPPGMPGYRDASIYPLQGVNNASLTRARALARGNTRSGKAVFYAHSTAPGPAIAQVVQFNLRQIGIDVEIKQFSRIVQADKVGTRGEPFDISHSGWGADYPDPYNFINVLLDGRRIQATNNVNESYFNSSAYNRKLEQASRLTGAARRRAYGNLDADIMRKAAPLAPYMVGNERYFVSENVRKVSFSEFFGYVLGGIELAEPVVAPPPAPPPPGPPPPAPPSCSQAVRATLTAYLGEPHAQVLGECAGLLGSGLYQIRMQWPVGKTLNVYAKRPGSTCTQNPTDLVCTVPPDGRICTILYLQPDAAVNDPIRYALERQDGTAIETKDLPLGASEPTCPVGS